VTVYFDTSSLIKLYVDEPGAEEVHRLVHEADLCVTSVLAYPEARATLARRRRERLMTAAETRAAIAALDADWPRFVVLAFDDDLARAAGGLADTHGIRGGDAVHLASFEIVLSTSEDDDIHFSCADERLAKAARALGHEEVVS
jgi:predicted nucleic acid-binding protein